MATKQIDPEVSDDENRSEESKADDGGSAEVTSKSAPDTGVSKDDMEQSEVLIEDESEIGIDERSTEDDSEDFSSKSAAELAQALMSAKEQIGEMKDGFLRAKAEMENIRRRSQNEIVAARKYAIEGFAQELLNVVDSLDQAAQVELSDDSGEAVEKMKEGLALTLKQMETVMSKFAVTEVEAGPGVKFNPEHHQAISMIDSDQVESNHIIDVMQKGFLLKDRLLRPAMVVVAS